LNFAIKFSFSLLNQDFRFNIESISFIRQDPL
jgi:hypothetical protein